MALPAGLARSSADPGVSSTAILLGADLAADGPAAAYASWRAARRRTSTPSTRRGGVAKRKIEYKIMDDGYNPAQTVQAVRRLVEQDRVFAVFNTLVDEHNLAIRDYLNQMKVPQPRAPAPRPGGETRRSTCGRSASSRATRPWAGLRRVEDAEEGEDRRLFQNDDYGKDLLGGLKPGRAPGSKVIAAQPYQVTSLDVGSQIARLKASAPTSRDSRRPRSRSRPTSSRTGWAGAFVINNGVSGTEHRAASPPRVGRTRLPRAPSRARSSATRPTRVGRTTPG